MFGERVVGVLPNLIVAYMFVGLFMGMIVCADIIDCMPTRSQSIGTFVVGFLVCSLFWPITLLFYVVRFLRYVYLECKEENGQRR